MKKNIKILTSSILAAKVFFVPQIAQSTENLSVSREHQNSIKMLLKEVATDTLEAVLGSGKDALLKIRMDLKKFREPVEGEHLKVPVQLFLTDFISSPTPHPTVVFQVKVTCEPVPLKCMLPNKPEFFSSYQAFTDWLEQGYLTNVVFMTYDFHVDIKNLAPSLAEHLFFFQPDGYHFIGSHVINNTKIIPDNFEPKISFVSERGDINTTTVPLGGGMYLSKKSYPIEDHQQLFFHRIVEENITKRDEGKKFYCHKWVAQSEITSKVTYEEFPVSSDNESKTNQTQKTLTVEVKDWPGMPSEIYSVVQQKPGDKEEIEPLSFLHGKSGYEIDTNKDIKICKIISEGAEKQAPNNVPIMEYIVKDKEKNLYIVQFRYKRDVQAAIQNLRVDDLVEEYLESTRYKETFSDKIAQLVREQEQSKKSFYYWRYQEFGIARHHNRLENDEGQRKHDEAQRLNSIEQAKAREGLSNGPNKIKQARDRVIHAMQTYREITSEQHPRWDEFRIM